MADRALDLIGIGRAAVDLYGEQVPTRLGETLSFARHLGGCAANIAVGTSRLGLRSAMIARVGDERMGRFVREQLAAERVDVSRVRTDPSRLTALVILDLRDRRTMPHIFYRTDCADMALEAADIEPEFVASATALVVTGTHFSTARVDEASRTAIRHAKAAGTRVIFDIDYRPLGPDRSWRRRVPVHGQRRRRSPDAAPPYGSERTPPWTRSSRSPSTRPPGRRSRP